MLVSFGNIDLIGYVLEVYEVLSEGCPKPFQTVGIIVNEPSPRGDNLRIVAFPIPSECLNVITSKLNYRRTFTEFICKWSRSSTPRTSGSAAKETFMSRSGRVLSFRIMT